MISNFKTYFIEVTKKDIMGGLHKIGQIRDPKNHKVYAKVTIDKNEGVLNDCEYFDPPKLLPENSIFLTDKAFKQYELPAEQNNKFIVYITDKRIAMDLYFLAGSDDYDNVTEFNWATSYEEPLNSFYENLYSALNISRPNL